MNPSIDQPNPFEPLDADAGPASPLPGKRGAAIVSAALAAAWPAVPVPVPRPLGGWTTIALAVAVGATIAGAWRVHAHRVATRRAAAAALAAEETWVDEASHHAADGAPSATTGGGDPSANRRETATLKSLLALRFPDRTSNDELFRRAEEQRRQKHPREAATIYRSIVDNLAYPETAVRALLAEADVELHDLHDAPRALETYREAHAKLPNSWTPGDWTDFARGEVQRGQTEAAGRPEQLRALERREKVLQLERRRAKLGDTGP